MKKITIADFFIGDDAPFVLICGPCIIESEEHCLKAATFLKQLCLEKGIKLIFKSSYDKANRSSSTSFRGPGLQEGLRILQKVKEELNLPITTDIHSPEEAKAAGDVCDVIQVPAFLCRQTDLILAAGLTGAVVNVKKGQFMAPWDMKNVVDKIRSTGNEKIILTERGTCFGYNNLVSDMRSIPIMQTFGYPVCFDATHSAQLPGGLGTSTGGMKEHIPTLAKAAVAAGCDLLFMEAHPEPSLAKSDSSTVLDYQTLSSLLDILLPLYALVHPQAAPV